MDDSRKSCSINRSRMHINFWLSTSSIPIFRVACSVILRAMQVKSPNLTSILLNLDGNCILMWDSGALTCKDIFHTSIGNFCDAFRGRGSHL